MALSNKHQAFVNEYLKCWNAAEAARRAGYNGKSNVVGSQLLANLSIRAEIEARLNEMQMSANEVLLRLANMARSNIADFVHVSSAKDVQDLGDAAQVIKKFKRRKYYPKGGDPYDEIEIELYPADANLERIGRHHGLFNNDAGTEDKPFVVKVIKGMPEV